MSILDCETYDSAITSICHVYGIARSAVEQFLSGVDLDAAYESYVIFQSRVIKEYKKMVKEYGLVKLDATDSIHSKQVKIREMLKSVLKAKGIEV